MDATLSDNTMQELKSDDVKTFTFNGKPQDPFSTWLVEGIELSFKEQGYHYLNDANETINIVFNLTDKENPQPFRRKSQGTFVVSVIETDEEPNDDVLKVAYPYLIRTVSNHVLYIVRTENNTDIYSITPEQGRYKITIDDQSSDDKLFDTIYKRLEPLASSQLVINNLFHDDLPEELWEGDEVTNSLRESGKKLDKLNLLPAPFPLEDFLTKRDIRHLKKLYGIGGLSYGNLSARKDGNHFWMSASGIDKGNMQEVGKDFLYIIGYDETENAMDVSVPPNMKPKRASVDAIEHWMIYKEHPEVGAIVHVHGWIEGVKATQFNYPCGTIELAQNVADIVREAEDPSRTIVGLKNHGITITGRSLEDIFNRIEGKILPHVPMD